MTSSVPPPRFPPYPIRGVHVLHKKINCAPQFAGITVDFEPADDGFVFEVAEGLTVEYERPDELPGFFAAAAEGIQERLSLPECEVVTATRAVLRQARAHTFGSHPRAFKVAGHFAALKALEQAGVRVPRP